MQAALNQSRMNEKIFEPIVKRPSISSHIVEIILSKIKANELKPGDILPTEMELSRRFVVGRNTVREAMKTLEATGLIEVTKKRRIICPPKKDGWPPLGIEISSRKILEIFEVRKIFEVGMVQLAAIRADQQDISKMSDAISKTDKWADVIASDISFHAAIVTAAENSFLSSIFQSIAGMFFQVHKTHSLWKVEENRKLYIAQGKSSHQQILKAIESRDQIGAGRAMAEHLDNVEKWLYELCKAETEISL